MWRTPGAAPRGGAAAVRAYIAFRVCSPSLEDSVVATFTGGRHVHCEMAYLVREPGSADRLLSIGAIFPGGVYMSDAYRDPYYGMCDADGVSLPVQLQRGAGRGGWEWWDVTDMFDTPARLQAAYEWNGSLVDKAEYNTAAIFAYAVPCVSARSPARPSAGGLPPHQDKYMCSELCAETLRVFSTDAALLRDLAAAGRRFGGLGRGGSAHITPHALQEVVERDGRARFQSTRPRRRLAPRRDGVGWAAQPHGMCR
jgi:hypothetical protein